MSPTKQEVVVFLEDLVHKRFSEKRLNKVLSDFFKQDLKVYNASQGRIDNGEYDDELTDFNLMVNVDSDGDSDAIDIDIYMLPMRRKGWDDSDMYITEVGYEFW